MSTMENSKPVPVGGVNWGDLRRQQPLSDRWGFDRGQPVDRYYIENFLARHSATIRGTCIELMNSGYTRTYGNDRVIHADVVDINPNNANATIVGDLVDPKTLAAGRYDCFILTQTLQVIFDFAAALRNCYAAVKSGGTLLITVPCMCRYSPHPEDYWRFTDHSLRRLIAENTDCEDFEVESHGNLVASIAFTVGMASEELTKEELDFRDVRFPIVTTARLRKK